MTVTEPLRHEHADLFPHVAELDIAAADLILQEAGGCLTGLDGSTPTYNRPHPSHDEMIAVASRLHPRAIGAMRA